MTRDTFKAKGTPTAARGDVRGLDRLGWVRRDAIERLRNDLDVTGVMVHDEERTDSVPVYLAAEGVQAGEVEDSETAWREGWAMAYSGADHLYGDDGELQDNRWPCIDWRRDSALEIRRKIKERANRAWQAHLSQQPEARGVVDGWRLVVHYGEYDSEPGVWAEKGGSLVWIATLTGERNG